MSKNLENRITTAELLIDRKTDATIKQIINGTKTDNSFSLLMSFFQRINTNFLLMIVVCLKRN